MNRNAERNNPAQQLESSSDGDTSVSEEPEPQLHTLSEPYRDVGMESLPPLTKQEIRAGQKEDPVIGPVLHFKSCEPKTKP